MTATIPGDKLLYANEKTSLRLIDTCLRSYRRNWTILHWTTMERQRMYLIWHCSRAIMCIFLIAFIFLVQVNKVTACEMEEDGVLPCFLKTIRPLCCVWWEHDCNYRASPAARCAFTLALKQYRFHQRNLTKRSVSKTRDASRYLLNLLTSFSLVAFDPEIWH